MNVRYWKIVILFFGFVLRKSNFGLLLIPIGKTDINTGFQSGDTSLIHSGMIDSLYLFRRIEIRTLLPVVST